MNSEDQALTAVPISGTPDGRIVELLRVLQEAEGVSLRFDIDDEGPEAESARNTADRVLEELGAVLPNTAADAQAALRFIRKAYMSDRAGVELGTEELAFLNLVDGVEQFVRQRAP